MVYVFLRFFNYRYSLKVFLIAFFSLIALANNVYAVTIVQNQSMDFATLLVPTSGSEYIIIQENNGSAVGTGTVILGTTRRGEFTVTGDNNSGVFTLNIDSVVTGSSDITLNSFRATYNGTLVTQYPSQPLPQSTSPKNLYLGAKLTYNNSVTSGVKNVTFRIVYTMI